ncbi:NLP/P60 protein [[Clostridium] sordellii]|uniref:C40 family peptidase n=2 Tax=Paraclostridium sordellii TaxID=1505 RepID=UPI0005E4FC2D|nr:C40 family peptidase [Paeniclostridium sordellii]CEN23259.1 NLP/P60 protein [[Clostridium] sordellii] [Paeniclostridium sordellii]
MNKKILTILGVSAISLTLSTDIIFANNSYKEEAAPANYLSTPQASAQQIVNYAKQQLGKPYVWDTAGPNTFDCSGFIYYVFSHNGYNISRNNVESYWGNSNIKKVSSHKPGDLIFFKGTYGGTNYPSHIGIMINDTQFIHAANKKTGVIITNLDNPYWKSHILGYGRIIPESANKKPVYRIETGGFVGMKRAKYEVGFLKAQFGWDATIKPTKSDNKYSIITGGFTGMKRAKYEVGFLKAQFGWDAAIKPTKSDNKYSIITGGFTGMKRAKYEVGFLKAQFGWNATIKPNKSDNKYSIETGGFSRERAEKELKFLKGHFGWDGVIEPIADRPYEYKILIFGFTGEDIVEDAKRRLDAATGWYTETCPDDSNEYKLVIDGFVGEDEVATAKQRLDGWTGWYTETCPDDSNEYKLVIDGFVGEDEVATAKQRLDGWTGWYTEYIPTGEYK